MPQKDRLHKKAIHSKTGMAGRILKWGGGGCLCPGHEFVGGSEAILPQKILKSKCRPRKKWAGGGGGAPPPALPSLQERADIGKLLSINVTWFQNLLRKLITIILMMLLATV